MNLTTLMTAGLGVALGALAGALLYAWWLRRQASVKLRSVGKWPLAPRGLVTTREHEVWTWLRRTFHEHVVLVKVPVQRFTTPLDKEKGRGYSKQLLQLLSGVYTTFTVSTTDGKVVGCVDVPGKRGLRQDDFELKEALLADCGIAYTVVRGLQLPAANAMRAAFLGVTPIEQIPEYRPTRGGDSSFHAELDAFTKQKMRVAQHAALKELNEDAQQSALAGQNRKVGAGTEGAGSSRMAGEPDGLADRWDDSFNQPLDTRPARLD